MPRFPINDSAHMTKEERFTSVTIYLAKVVDHLQGNEESPSPVILPRALPAENIHQVKTIAQVAIGLKESAADS